MYLTNHQLVEQLAKADPNKVIPLLEVIYKLFLRYGKKIRLDSFLGSIKKDHAEIVDLINMLGNLDKLRTTDITGIINTLKLNKTYTNRFTIYSDNEQKELSSKLEKSQNGNVEFEKSDKTGVRVQWEWHYYDRSLDRDLNILLN